MSKPSLPTAEQVAVVMSSVTEPMCGTRFEPCDPQARGESVCGRMFVLSFDGAKRDINVLLSCGPADSHLLAASLFGISPEAVPPAAVDAALRNLLNVVAAQLARLLQVDAALGVARRTTLAEVARQGGPGIADGVLLRSTGRIDIRLWIFERLPPAKRGPVALFRSLVKALRGQP
jgi:hypothetical protein